MRYVIQGREYAAASIEEISLTDLLALTRELGWSVDELQNRLTSMADFETPEEALNDEESLLALGALIWLTRRRAGERLSFEEACDFPLSSLDVVLEDGDEAAIAAAAQPDPPSAVYVPAAGRPRKPRASAT